MQTSALSSELNTEQHAQPRIRLEFLDGLRGIAALYVASAHIVGEASVGQTAFYRIALHWLCFGRIAVAVFIVLSGYCLMLPVARDPEGKLSGGFTKYIARRAKRILPPYYAAIFFTLIITIASRTGWQYIHGEVMASGKAATLYDTFNCGNILTHLLLIHNFSIKYYMNLDPPTWSVATEWQIYFLFPALLIPLWHRFGMSIAVIVALILGMLPQILLPNSVNLNWACPWYLGLFAIGMYGALITFGVHPSYARIKTWRWGIISAVGATFSVGLMIWHDGALYPAYGYLPDTVIGITTFSVIIYCVLKIMQQPVQKSRLVTILESRPAVKLGSFSYSLYLIHQPLTLKIGPFISHLPESIQMPVLIIIVMPLVLVFSYLFYLCFEKPYTAKRAKEAILVS